MSAGTCGHCGKACSEYVDYCNWDCHVAAAETDGGQKVLPNGLPVGCIKTDGTMLEHEHGDHPDYKFPVEVEYVGSDYESDEFLRAIYGREVTNEERKRSRDQVHALIYTDGSVAVTMHEYCYAMWYLDDGRCGGGSLWNEPKDWRLSAKSCAAISILTGAPKRG